MIKKITTTSIFKETLGILVFATSWLIIYRFAICGVDSHHQGLVFKNALDVAHGKILYRDSFSQYGCIQVWIHALLLHLFGEKLIVIMNFSALIYALIIYLVYRTLSNYIPAVCSSILCIVLLFSREFYRYEFLPWSNIIGTLALFLCMSSYLLLAKGYNSTLCTILISLFAFIAFWIKLPIGAVAYLAIFVITLAKLLSRERIGLSNLAIFFTTALLFHGAIFLYFYKNNAMQPMIQQLFTNALSFAKQNSGTIYHDASILLLLDCINATISPILMLNAKKQLFSFTHELFSCLIVRNNGHFTPINIMPFICIILFFHALHTMRTSSRNSVDIYKTSFQELILSVFALAAWSQYYPVSDPRHIAWGNIIMFCTMSIGLYIHLPHSKRRSLWISLFALFVFHPQLINAVTYGSATLRDTTYEVSDPGSILAGMKFQKEEADYYNDIEYHLAQLSEQYPEYSYVNYSNLNILSCYDNFLSFGPYYSLYGSDSESLSKFCRSDKVIIFSDRQLTRYMPEYFESKKIKGDIIDTTPTGAEQKLGIFYSNTLDLRCKDTM